MLPRHGSPSTRRSRSQARDEPCTARRRTPVAAHRQNPSSSDWRPARLERDRHGDRSPAQIGAVGARALCLVREGFLRAGPRPPLAQAGHRNRFEHCGELGAVRRLPGRRHQRQHLAALLARQMSLAGPPTAGPPQRVIGRLGIDPAGRLDLPVTVVTSPSRAPMRPHDGGVHTHPPDDAAGGIGERLQQSSRSTPTLPHAASHGTARGSSASSHTVRTRPATGSRTALATGYYG